MDTIVQEFLREVPGATITARFTQRYVKVSLKIRGATQHGEARTFDGALLAAFEEFMKLGSWAEHWYKRLEERYAWERERQEQLEGIRREREEKKVPAFLRRNRFEGRRG